MNNTFINQLRNREWIYSYFEEFKNDLLRINDESLNKFTTRITLIILTSISVKDSNFTEQEIEAHIFTLKLSDAWFAYEALFPAIERYGYKTIKPPVVLKPKSVDSIQTALSLRNNVYGTKEPFGKAELFDVSKTSDDYLSFLLENELDCFEQYISYILYLKKESRELLQKYMIYLEDNSLGPQKKYLLEAYNKFLHGSCAAIVPADIMCIAYAVRNQYVHEGEIIRSGLEDVELKAELLKACFNFVVNYSLIIATQIISDAAAH